MGYMHIENLYKDQRILLFKKCWATEKIHGTSAWITYKDNNLFYHSGGGSRKIFLDLFDHEFLLNKMREIFGDKKVKLHGEFYGGKINKMFHIYRNYGFIMFDINVEGVWLSHDKVLKLCHKLKLDVVESKIIPTTVSAIEEITNKPSALCLRRGLGEHIREGVVLKPLEEFRSNNDKRVIAKHKTEKYSELTTPRKIDDPERLKRIEDAKEVAFEWVTSMRLNHILDKFPNAEKRDTGKIIRAMIEDVKREGSGEVEVNREVEKEIGNKTRELFFRFLKSKLHD